MKKILVMFMLLTVLIFSLSAESRSLTVLGVLANGDVTFSATPVDAVRVDLTSDTVKSTGAGVKIGDYSVSRVRGGSLQFSMSYTYGPLTDQDPAVTTPEEIDIVLLVDDTDDGTNNPTEHASGSTSLLFNGSGGFSVTKEVLFRFTTTGDSDLETAPASDYNSDVTLTLVTT